MGFAIFVLVIMWVFILYPAILLTEEIGHLRNGRDQMRYIKNHVYYVDLLGTSMRHTFFIALYMIVLIVLMSTASIVSTHILHNL